jgi:hypothetical protein
MPGVPRVYGNGGETFWVINGCQLVNLCNRTISVFDGAWGFRGCAVLTMFLWYNNINIRPLQGRGGNGAILPRVVTRGY